MNQIDSIKLQDILNECERNKWAHIIVTPKDITTLIGLGFLNPVEPELSDSEKQEVIDLLRDDDYLTDKALEAIEIVLNIILDKRKDS